MINWRTDKENAHRDGRDILVALSPPMRRWRNRKHQMLITWWFDGHWLCTTAGRYLRDAEFTHWAELDVPPAEESQE